MTYHWQESQLTPEQVRRVEIFNRRLADLETRLKPHFETERPVRLGELNRRYPELSPFEDYNKEVTITLYLREDDPEYTDDYDHILASRTLNFALSNLFWADGQDHRVEYTTFLEKQGIGPVCWLFYHFYEEYSSDKRNLPLEDMARVGMIWLDIITTDQVALYEEE